MSLLNRAQRAPIALCSLGRLGVLIVLVLPVWCADRIVATDLLKIERVTEVRVTPDGAMAVYGVRSIHTKAAANGKDDPTYTYRTNVWMIDLRDSGAKPVQLTFGDQTDSELEISPDGRELAFVRPDGQKHPQIWILPLDRAGEARMVTTLEYGASRPRWRNDSQALLAESEIPISKIPGKPAFDLERPARDWWDYDRPALKDDAKNAKADEVARGNPDGDLRAIRDWLEHNSAKNDPADITRMAFLGELGLREEMTITELFRVDLGAEPKTTQLTASFEDHHDAVYSPDGSRILFASAPPSHLHPDRLENSSAIWEMNADGTNEHMLINKDAYAYREPQFTRDGKHLLVIGQETDQPTYRQARLGVCDPDGSHLEWLTANGEPGVENPEAAADGRVYYTVEYQGGQPLRLVDLKTRKVEDVVSGPVGVNAFASAPGEVVFAEIGVANPNELYLKSGAAEAKRVTELNTAWLAGKILSQPEEHWITRPDGTRVEYWVMKPVGAQEGKRYPWVLDIHGGPSAMWGPGEFTMWHEFQMFCAFGYGVVYANPRGSGGYGYAFERANFEDWGDGPMGDVMAALDDAQAHTAAMDKDRLFVAGGSYAGYLTAWIVGHTNRFKAAVAQRGVYDLATFFGEGNAYELVPYEFGGYPWEPETRKLLDRESPVTYVADIHTPLLIIHGSQDNRTGVAQSEMLFRALKQLNRPVEYIRYPGIGHELTRSGPPAQRMDHTLRMIEFFGRYSAAGGPGDAAENSNVH